VGPEAGMWEGVEKEGGKCDGYARTLLLHRYVCRNGHKTVYSHH
jgi:hypothetical protein